MDSKQIEALLAKYWECETTLKEEQDLREFFAGDQVPEELVQYKVLFTYFNDEKSIGLGADFDKKVLDKVKNTAEPKKKGKVVKLFYEISRVAAVILVLVVAGYFVKQEYVDKKDQVDTALTEMDTFDDPKKAFEETKKALQLISANFKKGKKQASKVSAFSEAKEKAKEIDVQN